MTEAEVTAMALKMEGDHEPKIAGSLQKVLSILHMLFYLVLNENLISKVHLLPHFIKKEPKTLRVKIYIS